MRDPETQLQITVAAFLDFACPYPWSAIGHGGGGRIRGAIEKAKGLKRGMPDILVFKPDGTVSIELKTKRGTLSDDQEALGDWLNGQPAHSYHLCRSVDDVEAALAKSGVKLLGRVV